MSDQPTSCDCWEKMDTALKLKGFRLHSDLKAISMSVAGPLKTVYQLPLQRADRSKCKRADPKVIRITHCPFCGTPYPTEEGGEG